LQGRKMGDTSITARQRFDAHSNSRNQRNRHVDSDQGTGHFREQVKEKHGIFQFTSSPRDDAPLEICVQCLSASHYTPIRFSLQILMEPYVDKASEEAKLREKLDGTVSTTQLDLQGLEQKLEMILAYSESAIEQEIRVHNRSISINRSSMYWPLIQIVILIVAGFMQANIVSKFFKKHHIV
jgi:emp24/gp25L/p24 family/GOLD